MNERISDSSWIHQILLKLTLSDHTQIAASLCNALAAIFSKETKRKVQADRPTGLPSLQSTGRGKAPATTAVLLQHHRLSASVLQHLSLPFLSPPHWTLYKYYYRSQERQQHNRKKKEMASKWLQWGCCCEDSCETGNFLLTCSSSSRRRLVKIMQCNNMIIRTCCCSNHPVQKL